MQVTISLSFLWTSSKSSVPLSFAHSAVYPRGRSDIQLQAKISEDAEATFTASSPRQCVKEPSRLEGCHYPCWDWVTHLRGGVSHPVGRKSRLEPSARPLFLTFLPFMRSGGLGCGWHNDFNVYFGLCHVPIPLAFKSSFFWLFSICSSSFNLKW